MKYCEFPTGYPTLLGRETFGNMQPWTKPEDNPYKGIIYCRVLAPDHLKRPLLSYRTKDGRLVFPLCRRCSDERNQLQPCTHENKDRSWTGGFTHSELNKALALGYIVLEVFEVHYYDKWARQGGVDEELPLFAGYSTPS